MYTQNKHFYSRIFLLVISLLLIVGCTVTQAQESTASPTQVAEATATQTSVPPTMTSLPTETPAPPTSVPPTETPTPLSTETSVSEETDLPIQITYPKKDATVSGEIDIHGSATHPNFKSYGVIYTTDKHPSADTAWQLDDPIAWDVEKALSDSILGTWDTTQYPNGDYSLALVVYEIDSDVPIVYIVDNVTIQNEIKPTQSPSPVPPSPTPFPASTPAGLESLDNFVVGTHVMTDDYLDAARYAGMTWIKREAQYPETYEKEIQTYHDAGFKVLLTASGKVIMPMEPTLVEDYAAWVAELVALGADAIEVWNEPNIERSWHRGDISPEVYTELLCASYDAIKAANPETYVISGAPAPTGWFKGCTKDGCDDQPWLERIYASGAAQCMDYIGAHHASGATSPSARSGHPADPKSTHPSWFFLPQTELYHEIFEGTHPIFYTSLGYASQEGVSAFPRMFEWAKGTTDAQQAAWLAEVVQLSLDTEMVHGIIVWNLNFHRRYGNDPQDGYAIVRPDGSCPACVALHEVLSQP